MEPESPAVLDGGDERSLQLRAFYEELDFQIRLMTIAWRELAHWSQMIVSQPDPPEGSPSYDKDIAAKTEASDRCCLYLRSFLSAAANISRVLWPGRTRSGDKSGWADRRASQLRRILRIDTSLFSTRAVRDALDHFDERLDRWFEDGNQYIYDLVIADDRAVAYLKDQLHVEPLRHLSVQTSTVTVAGEAVRLSDLMVAATSLRSVIQSVNADPAAHRPMGS